MTTTNEISLKVRAIIARYAEGAAASQENREPLSLVEMGISSVKMIEMILDIESEIGVSLPDEEIVISNFSTTESVINLVKRYVGTAPS